MSINQDQEETLAEFQDSEDEYITAPKVLEKLQSAWLNEKCAPVILQHQTEILELIIEQLLHMDRNMINLDKNDFKSIVHRMEIERIQYLISSYLRCRLKKIELFTKYILNEENSRNNDEKFLCENETKFATSYLETVENCFQKIALQYVPRMQNSKNEQIVRPNSMGHVFIKAKDLASALVVSVDDGEIDLASGSQHIVPFHVISDLLFKGIIELI